MASPYQTEVPQSIYWRHGQNRPEAYVDLANTSRQIDMGLVFYNTMKYEIGYERSGGKHLWFKV